MSFRFNFSNTSDVSLNEDSPPPDLTTAETSSCVDNPPYFHTLKQLVSTLPDNISYNTLTVTQTWHGEQIYLPRRELYDIRMQLMAEDDDPGDEAQKDANRCDNWDEGAKAERVALMDFVNGCEDVRAGVYEGGLKSWECSVDLVQWLAAQEGLGTGGGRVLELGCGTSLPTLLLFQSALRAVTSTTQTSPIPSPKFTFHLADYNYSVLRLVTLPNLLLSWILLAHPPLVTLSNGDLSVTSELREAFLSSLNTTGIQLAFISGSWGQDMLSILEKHGEGGKYDLVMGSETIYEPRTAPEFTRVLLGSIGAYGKGLVAAKRIYFGVGGSVGDFVNGVEGHGGEEGERRWRVRTIEEVSREMGGVGGVILEVTHIGSEL